MGNHEVYRKDKQPFVHLKHRLLGYDIREESLEHYGKMLNKVNAVGDLYSRANHEVFKMVQHWLEQEAKSTKQCNR